jgi:hypothetical protein
MHGLQQGNKVLSEIHKEMSIENVEKLMSETQEAIAYQNVRITAHLTTILKSSSTKW